MKFLEKLLAGPRLRDARRRLVTEPSAANYVALASEHARICEFEAAERVCAEGLGVHASAPELTRLRTRMRALQLEDRARALSNELRESPRAGLFRELAEVYLECGRLERAEELSVQWLERGGGGEAHWLRSRARAARYFADRRREDGRTALEWLDSAEAALPRDERPLRLRLELVCRIGAWRDARRTVAQLLELAPGDPALEARFRTYTALAESAPTLDAALREVERHGVFPEENTARSHMATGPSRALRPMLQSLAAQPTIAAVVYERGATALVQGPSGATAERAARAVREVAQKSRSAARRMGLGNVLEVELEGPSGSLLVLPSESGVAAAHSSAAQVPEFLRPTLGAIARSGSEGTGLES